LIFFFHLMTFKYWILVLTHFWNVKIIIQCEFYKMEFRLISLSVSQSKNSLVLAYKMVLVCMVLVYMVLVYKQLLFHQPFHTLVHGSYHDVCRMVHGCSRNTFPHVHHMNRPTWAKCCYNTVIYFVVVWKVVMFVESVTWFHCLSSASGLVYWFCWSIRWLFISSFGCVVVVIVHFTMTIIWVSPF